MAVNKTRLELTWIGKENRPRLEPRILLEDPTKSHHAQVRRGKDDRFDNRLIFGDNLLALKALEAEFAGKIKCICIDPPYNTGSAFEQYDDGIEHSLWLTMMRDRLELVRRLLAPNGTVWVFVDDNEAHYLKVLMDEVFGRPNHVQTVIWQRKASPANDAKWLSNDHDYILLYAKDKETWRPNRLTRTEEQNSYYTNPDEDPRGAWNSVTYTSNKSKTERPNLWYAIINPNTGEKVWPGETVTWRCNPETHAENVKNDLLYWGKDGKARMPRLKRFLDAAKNVVPRSVWLHEDVGHTQTAMVESKTLFAQPFATPKTEAVVQRILEIATNQGDWVLDSFAGSGTTGAVAHKMGRRWIMVEVIENSCEAYIIPRLKKVIDGTDLGGVTEVTGWKGGGGFRYARLAPSLLKKDKWGQWVINSEYNAEMLAAALCKVEGFRYAPSDTIYWQHGFSTESDFIYVTTQTLTKDMLRKLSDEVGEQRSLLVLCKAFKAKIAKGEFTNLTIKKIPKAVLAKCEWDKDDYSLEIKTLPKAPPEPLEEEPAVKPKATANAKPDGAGKAMRRKVASVARGDTQGDLFAAKGAR
jgi:adenine-specific DNA-methyltransferase